MEFYIIPFKENMICLGSNGGFKYIIQFKFNHITYIKIILCKFVRPRKLMWHNIMRSTKSQTSWVYEEIFCKLLLSNSL